MKTNDTKKVLLGLEVFLIFVEATFMALVASNITHGFKLLHNEKGNQLFFNINKTQTKVSGKKNLFHVSFSDAID